MSADEFTIGIDIGGTYTDLVVEGNDRTRFKVSTTPNRLVEGIRAGLDEAAAHHGLDRSAFLDATELIVHGTTVTTNALLEGEAATTGLLTTEGFRDVLERNMESSAEVYDLRREPSTALVPRYLRREVPGRLDSDGDLLEALDEPAAERAIDRLVDADVRAIGVALMSAYADDRHERRLAELIDARADVDAVSVSSAVHNTIGLHDRSIAAQVDASLKPIVREYLRTIEAELRAAGFGGQLLLMQGNGGVTTAETIAEQPITSVNSGPAGGAVSAAHYAERTGFSRVISLEMGGTSTDVCLVPDGEPLVSTDNAVGETPIPLPMVDVSTIGAGGGSVAWIDDRGVMQVGPKSAGSDPGPICYGRGGTRPTVTDADLVLGYLNPEYFLDGAMALDREAARAGIEEQLATPLDISVAEAAAGVRTLTHEGIATQLRQVSIERGYDPREFVVVTGGGAGPVHAAALAKRFDVEAVVPRAAGTLSAVGLLEADVKHDFARSVLDSLSGETMATVERAFAAMERDARDRLADGGGDDAERSFQRRLDTRYAGQVHEITLEVALDDDRADVEARHHARHARQYGFADEDATIEVVTARLSGYGRTDGVTETRRDGTRSGEGVPAVSARKGRRSVFFPGVEAWRDTPIYDGSETIRDTVEGPGIVEFAHTTLAIPPRVVARTDPDGNFVLDPDTS